MPASSSTTTTIGMRPHDTTEHRRRRRSKRRSGGSASASASAAAAVAIDFFGTMTEYTGRSVRFEEGRRLERAHAPPVHELSDEERRALWHETTDDDEVGYDLLIDAASAARSAVIRGVLSEQERQRRNGSRDETRLFFASSRRSEAARQEALLRGMEDASKVKEYLLDWLSGKGGKSGGGGGRRSSRRARAEMISRSCSNLGVDAQGKWTSYWEEEKTCASKSCSRIIDGSSMFAFGENEVAFVDHKEATRKQTVQLHENNSATTLPKSVVVRKSRRSSVDTKKEENKKRSSSKNTQPLDDANQAAEEVRLRINDTSLSSKGSAYENEAAKSKKDSDNAQRLSDALFALRGIQKRSVTPAVA